GGVLTFTKTGAAAASTEYIGLADGVVDNRFPAPWTVEFTIPDATDFVADGAYLVARFWKPGDPLADWVAVANTGGTINIALSGGSPVMYSFDAGTTTSLKLKFDVELSGLT